MDTIASKHIQLHKGRPEASSMYAQAPDDYQLFERLAQPNAIRLRDPIPVKSHIIKA